MRKEGNSRRPQFGARIALAGILSLINVPQGLLEASTQLTGYATYYTIKSCKQEGTSGTTTASGLPYNESALTLALPHRRFGGRYRVCHGQMCREALHLDFGPGKKARARGVIADATPALFDALGCQRGVTRQGVAWGECQVTVERVE